MNFTEVALKRALAADSLEFPPVFNTNGVKRKRAVADADAEVAASPLKKRTKRSGAAPSGTVVTTPNVVATGSGEPIPDSILPLEIDKPAPMSTGDADQPSPTRKSQKSKRVTPGTDVKSRVATPLPQKSKKKKEKTKRPRAGETSAPRQDLVGREKPNPTGNVESSLFPEEVIVDQHASEDVPSGAPQTTLSPDHSCHQVGASPPRASLISTMSHGSGDQTPTALLPLRLSSPTDSHPIVDGQTCFVSNQQPSPVDFMLTDPFLGSMRGTENPDLDGVAREAISSLLRAGCLFAKLSQDSATTAEVEELRQRDEGYRHATLKAHGERDKLLTQVAAQMTKLNNLGIEMSYREADLSACESRTEELEDERDDLQ
ncbi:uncharacterized protein LOC130720580 isoform X1 [Lotus japonicus]|uniref:uncharacterized protein LOC130720580 isoform X1 n=1 Tax=Lotus japonicus TaxID=34305 RepID=UPI0025834799|nr:uncharacterized protein LOC130720580 isoform X1 [Lotus japonicus]